MTRPWHRSPVLWFGLPGLIFLVFAWIDSMSYSSGLQADVLGRSRSFSNSGAAVSVSWRSEPGIRGGGKALKFGRLRRDPWPRQDWFPLPAYVAQNNVGTTISHSLSISYWFIILTYLGLWQLPWLFRYHRRRRIERNLTSTFPAAAD
jgi:hypothetical protein